MHSIVERLFHILNIILENRNLRKERKNHRRKREKSEKNRFFSPNFNPETWNVIDKEIWSSKCWADIKEDESVR